MNHLVVATTAAWAVAYDRGDGQAVALCECPTEASAQREAWRLNAIEAAQRNVAQRLETRHDIRQARGRHVRYFEPDVYA